MHNNTDIMCSTVCSHEMLASYTIRIDRNSTRDDLEIITVAELTWSLALSPGQSHIEKLGVDWG